MENHLVQQQSQQQLQQLSPTQMQGLQLLFTPVMELESKLAAELENNPLLEVVSPAREELCGDTFSDAQLAATEPDRSEFDDDRESFPLLEALTAGNGEDYSDREYNVQADDLQKQRNFAFDSLTSNPTLLDIVNEQLQFCTLSKRERQAAELVTASLDEHGFLSTHPADLAMSGNFSMEEITQAVKLIQSFDPPGVGACSSSESLILQLKRRNYPDERIYTLIQDHQEELERNQLPQIAKAMKISVEDIYSFLHDLQKLNRFPAAGLNISENSQIVVPEMSIILNNGQLSVDGREGFIPRLGLVKSYLKMLEDPTLPDDTIKYLKEKLASAESLIKSLELRQDTLTRITNVIARKQAGYFLHGSDAMQPMTMTEVAKELNLHETTISRAVAGKYLDTPQGLKEYRFFFSGGYKKSDGEDISSRSVKARIRELIDNEDPAKPLSDAAIEKELKSSGLNIARRTITKYRESMNIPPTNLRRRH
ncbi:MAG: RNA polymerase factor sigma-54 [Lentisphaerae bacterium]|nr:RNA polymerase factor sigma-54 [Lentisphaerota bacterium]